VYISFQDLFIFVDYTIDWQLAVKKEHYQYLNAYPSPDPASLSPHLHQSTPPTPPQSFPERDKESSELTRSAF
jgi:hypothetical protein